MRWHLLNTTSVSLLYQNASSLSAKNNLLKRFLYHLRINFLPTILMLVFSGIIALYFSELIDRAKLRSNDLKPDHVSHARPVNAQTQAFTE